MKATSTNMKNPSTHLSINCQLCYDHIAHILSSCGCYYCEECYQASKSFNSLESARCIICNKSINYNYCINGSLENNLIHLFNDTNYYSHIDTDKLIQMIEVY